MSEGNEKPIVIVASRDFILSRKIGRIVSAERLKCIRTDNMDRIITELKRPGRCVIVDVNWKEVQQVGVLRKFVNLAAITENKVVCMCPNTKEELKKLANNARPNAVFIRYDLLTSFTDYIAQLAS